MKNDTKLYLTLPLWMPAFFIGTAIGIIVSSFVVGLESYRMIRDWMDNSEKLKDRT